MFKIALSFITAFVVAQSGISTKKDIKVLPTTQQRVPIAQSTYSYDDTIVYARGTKREYFVNERIRVQLKIRRNAYIYFWTVSASGKGYLILPNSFDTFNKYRKNLKYVVPNRSSKFSFVSDREGIERIYILATNKRISAGTIRSIFNYRSGGGVVPTASHKDISNFISKDIKVIAKRENFKYDIKSFDIEVYNRSR